MDCEYYEDGYCKAFELQCLEKDSNVCKELISKTNEYIKETIDELLR